jgi:PA14 domain
MQSVSTRACVRTAVSGLVLLCSLIVLLGPAAPLAAAQPPPQEPGVTQRVFQLPRALTEICTIKEGQTPNVDVLKPTIQWTDDAAFGGHSQNFMVHAIANLHVPAAGTYTFRLRSDDGSELLIGDDLVIDHDGLHGATDKDGGIELTAGVHPLRVNYF